MDTFALEDIGRVHNLSVPERYLLDVLTRRANHRVRAWAGTRSDLAEITGMSRNTVHEALGRLTALGLVSVRAEFGPNRKGCVEVLVYDDLVVPSLTAQKRAVEPETDRAATAQNSANGDEEPRSIRAVNAQNSANAYAMSSNAATPRGIEGIDAFNGGAKLSADMPARNSKTGVVVVDRVGDRRGEFSGAAHDDDVNRCYHCGQFDCVCDLR